MSEKVGAVKVLSAEPEEIETVAEKVASREATLDGSNTTEKEATETGEIEVISDEFCPDEDFHFDILNRTDESALVFKINFREFRVCFFASLPGDAIRLVQYFL